MDLVEAVKYVDEVVPQTNYNKIEAWNNLKFDKMFVGDDWKGTCLLYTSPSPRD